MAARYEAGLNFSKFFRKKFRADELRNATDNILEIRSALLQKSAFRFAPHRGRSGGVPERQQVTGECSEQGRVASQDQGVDGTAAARGRKDRRQAPSSSAA